MMLACVAARLPERKLRLYACACTRHVWPHLAAEDQGRQLVELHEQYADGLVSRAEVAAAAQAAWEAAGGGFDSAVERRGKEDSPEQRAVVVACLGLSSPAGAAKYFTDHCWRRDNDQERSKLCELFREICGNPFRPIAVAMSSLTWNAATVVRLAQAAYEDRLLPSGHLDTDRLAVLADALEEAGCSDAELLGHLRGPGPHVSGWWVLDLLLEKS
jgi:hypothetical protein